MKITNICHYYTYPPLSGGQIRINKINKELSKNHKIEQFSFTPSFRRFCKEKISKGYIEYIFPIIPYQVFAAVLSRIVKIPFDFIVPFVFRFVRLPKKLKDSIKDCDVVIVEHPWLFSWIDRHLKKHKINKPIILVAHNVEYELQKVGIKHLFFWLQNRILKTIKKTEKNASDSSKIIFCMTQEDKIRLVETYNLKKEKIVVIPNGVDYTYFCSIHDKLNLRKILGFKQHDKIIIFAGSKHPPNDEAVSIIEKKIAPNLPGYKFIIAGSVRKEGIKNNIFYTGKLENIKDYFFISDVAITPIINGSGSNVKTFEYLAAGLPVVSTKKGIIGIENKDIIIQSSIVDFPINIPKLFKNRRLLNRLSKRGVNLAKEHSWSNSAIIANEIIRTIVR